MRAFSSVSRYSRAFSMATPASVARVSSAVRVCGARMSPFSRLSRYSTPMFLVSLVMSARSR